MYPVKYPDETEKRYQQRILERFAVDEQLRKSEDCIDLICLFFHNIPYSFMCRWADVLDWKELCHTQHLSNDFMDGMSDFIDWSTISWGQKLTEWFMDKYQDKLNWYSISRSQKMSEQFLYDHFDKIELIELLKNKKTKASETFWRTAFALKPDYNINCINTFAIRFSIDFVREFRNRFIDLDNRYINIDKEQKEKIDKEFEIESK